MVMSLTKHLTEVDAEPVESQIVPHLWALWKPSWDYVLLPTLLVTHVIYSLCSLATSSGDSD